MKGKIVYFLVVCMLILTACGRQEPDAGKMIQQHSAEVAHTSQESIQLQKKLALWYNLNLRSEYPDVGFERAYNSILFFSDGMLGYVEIPSAKMYIPIYHEFRQDGFYLDPYSAFPTGREGNRTKLHISRSLVLTDGDVFHIYVLGDVLTYEIGGEGSDQCVLICEDASYEGARMVEDCN